MTHSKDTPPLVLLVCIDALRYDCVNWQPETTYFQKFAMPRRLRTPTLDRIGAESVRFHRAVSHAGYTPLSLATTMTGSYAKTHGVVDFQNTRCRDEVEPLASRFKARGWRTCSVCGPEFIDSIGLARDVDHVFTSEEPLLKLLEDDPDTPTFAFVHFNDVHHPYVFQYWDDPRVNNLDFELLMQIEYGLWVDHDTREFVDAKGARVGFDKWPEIIATPGPEDRIAQRVTNLFKYYLHGIQKFDGLRLASFVDRLSRCGLWDRAVTAFFADHGEIIWPLAPWIMSHGKVVDEQLMRVPLTIKAPGLEPKDVRTLVGLVDLYPTLLELAGWEGAASSAAHELDGRSLLPVVERDEPVQPDYYHEGWSVLVADERRLPVLYQRAIRTQDDRKYLLTGDLMDPAEFEPLEEDEFIRYVIERALGEIAYSPTCDTIRQHLSKGASRSDLTAGLTANVARFRRFNLKDDPFEERGEVMNPEHPDWNDFLRQLVRLVDMKGVPNLIDEQHRLSSEDERKLLAHLGELGYVEV